jgi:TPR repeat protein
MLYVRSSRIAKVRKAMEGRMADPSDAVELFDLALRYAHGTAGVAKNAKETVRLYRLAADKGLPAAQCNLGVCYQNGVGVQKDMTEAARLYMLAADQGLALAHSNLGLCYERGWGVAKDPAQSLRLYRLAADQGCAIAQFNLGVCYDKGIPGLPKDRTEDAPL